MLNNVKSEPPLQLCVMPLKSPKLFREPGRWPFVLQRTQGRYIIVNIFLSQDGGLAGRGSCSSIPTHARFSPLLLLARPSPALRFPRNEILNLALEGAGPLLLHPQKSIQKYCSAKPFHCKRNGQDINSASCRVSYADNTYSVSMRLVRDKVLTLDLTLFSPGQTSCKLGKFIGSPRFLFFF